MRRWVVPFAATHIGPDDAELAVMLERVGHESLDALTAAALPAAILDDEPLALPPAAEPAEVTQLLAAFAASNTIRRSLIGLGYAGTHTPPVIRRNVLESPAWYTAYTPYQPEISQGRLEALLTFQTVVADLTGMAVAGASMLDEPTAAAEAVALMRRASRAPAGAAVVVDADVLPATLAVVRTRADAIGMPVVVADVAGSGAPGSATALPPGEVFGVLVQQPGASGALHDVAGVVATARERGALVTVAADLLAATLVRSPGEEGADVAVGSAQRFGVPMGGGGPHAGFLAVRSGLERQLPGRLVGVSVDADGAPAYRLALQTREQHIRRDRATSNICTAQVLLAVMAGMYAVVHGPHGLAEIATRTAGRAACLAARLAGCGWQVVHRDVVDTVQLRLARPGQGSAAHVADAAVAAAAAAGYWIRRVDAATIGLACDETTTAADVDALVAALGPLGGQDAPADGAVPEQRPAVGIPEHLARTSAYLTHPVFSAHRSETSVLRYLRRLADADYALDRGMIPLGSCTMKLNATVELEPVSWPAFADLHPFAPAADAAGTAALVADLEAMLAEVTGYAAVSVQPNAGSQGELAGLLAIRAFHDAAAAAAGEGASRRRVCLVPASAHGTNAASAVMAGLRVVAVATGGDGALDLADLAAKVSEHADDLAAIMVTYPSTHGVYEESITTVCDLVHAAGGQVYVDGANLNALVGLARPGRFGADVSHLNLHKTFCIPHGGGGPGVGPVAVAAHLAPFLPGRGVVGQVSGAPWGSAGILPVSWAYLRLMGPAGLRRATQVAVASANYVAARLSAHFPVLYTGANTLVAHECVLDLRPMTKETGVSVEDVAKRLVDYGFHAPTVSFPVAGTLMVEPTESEDLAELDRFCDAMAAIAAEVDAVRAGRWSLAASPLRQAPHTAAMLVGDWDHPYTRAQAVYPAGQPGQPGMGGRVKYWPPVRRIDGAHGDRNLFCSCPPVAELAQVEV